MSDHPPAPKPFYPMQTQNVYPKVPESVAQAAYEVCCEVWGPQPAMMDLTRGCRGGFSVGEYIAFLYARAFPKSEWRHRVDEALERAR